MLERHSSQDDDLVVFGGVHDKVLVFESLKNLDKLVLVFNEGIACALAASLTLRLAHVAFPDGVSALLILCVSH